VSHQSEQENKRAVVDQDEVDRANFAGRLHPSQRKIVMEGAGPGYFLIVFGCLICGFVPLSDHKSSSTAAAVGMPLFLAAAFVLGGLVLVVRRLLHALRGQVRMTSGWSTIEARDQPSIKVRANYDPRKQRADYIVNVGAHTFHVDRELYVRVQPDQDNTAFISTFKERIVNVAATRR
jgi:hypothetical protein